MINRAELKQLSKQQIKGNIGTLFVCYLIIIAISAVIGALNFIPFLGMIASILVTPALSLGLIIIYLGITNGKKAEIADLFKGFNQYVNVIVLYVLVAVFTMLWSLLLVIPGIIKAYSYSMSFYILAEHPEMSAREALNESKAMMVGHKWEFFVLQLSFILWGLLGAITLGIAYIWIAPYMTTTYTNYYHAIKRINVEPVVETATQE